MHLSTSTCPNCETALQADFRYCPGCSQTTHLHRFSIGHIAHEAVHTVLHVDTTIVGLARELAVRPGVAAYEYIVLGKRKKYFSPFVFLLLVLGLELFVYSTIKPFTKNSPPSSTTQPAGNVSRGTQRELRLTQVEMMQFVERNSKQASVLAIPLLALAGWLAFRRRGVNYAEHVVINVFIMCITSSWSILLILLTDYLRPPWIVISAMSFCVSVTYIAVCYHQFFRRSQPISWLRAISVAFLSYSGLFVIQFIVMLVYLLTKLFQGA
ncbi:zinc ribbon domain-containing protein [Fibrella sp. ES10-3-2-2]|nr:hypothetical protein A6C57_04970 [Fibrella sp. ES10-3-2-2]